MISADHTDYIGYYNQVVSYEKNKDYADKRFSSCLSVALNDALMDIANLSYNYYAGIGAMAHVEDIVKAILENLRTTQSWNFIVMLCHCFMLIFV